MFLFKQEFYFCCKKRRKNRVSCDMQNPATQHSCTSSVRLRNKKRPRIQNTVHYCTVVINSFERQCLKKRGYMYYNLSIISVSFYKNIIVFVKKC